MLTKAAFIWSKTQSNLSKIIILKKNIYQCITNTRVQLLIAYLQINVSLD